MNLKVLATSLLLGVGAFLTPTIAQASTLEQIKNASYELYADGQAICSGQFVTPRDFLTASHCLIKGEHKFSIHREGEIFPLQIKTLNIEYDTAVFEVTDSLAYFQAVDVAPIMNEHPQLGDDVLGAQYPLAMGYMYLTHGVYVGEDKSPTGLPSKYSTVVAMDTASGSSGSGLYMHKGDQYYLIGTLQGGPPSDDFISFYSTLDGVHKVVDPLKYAQPAPTFGGGSMEALLTQVRNIKNAYDGGTSDPVNHGNAELPK